MSLSSKMCFLKQEDENHFLLIKIKWCMQTYLDVSIFILQLGYFGTKRMERLAKSSSFPRF